MTRLVLSALVASLCVTGSSSAVAAQSFERAFPPGSTVVLNGRFGDVRVVGSEERRLVIEGGEEGREFEADVGEERARIVARPRGRSEDLTIRVPPSTRLVVESAEANLAIEGIEGGIDVQIAIGAVELHDFRGSVRLLVLNGDIEVGRGEGHVTVGTGTSDVQVAWFEGVLEVEGATGDVEVTDSPLRSASIRTVSGDIQFEGSVAGAGPFVLSTHDGKVDIELGDVSDVSIEVSTFSGTMQVDFPVSVHRFQSGDTQVITIGSADRSIVVATFSGDVTIQR